MVKGGRKDESAWVIGMLKNLIECPRVNNFRIWNVEYSPSTERPGMASNMNGPRGSDGSVEGLQVVNPE